MTKGQKKRKPLNSIEQFAAKVLALRARFRVPLEITFATPTIAVRVLRRTADLIEVNWEKKG